MRVLIAEDDAVSRMILRRAIEKLGHECHAAEDGEEAWRAYKAAPDGFFDVVISDWMMPGMDGPALCAKVRALREAEGRESYPFFVFLTALGDKDHLLEGMRAGADDYLKKPLDRSELAARLLVASRVTTLHRKLIDQNKRLEELNAELFEQARHDPLTHLGNRLLLREDLEALVARTERYGHSYCALLCDVDSFKLYNDHYGHLMGDEVLRSIANAIVANARVGDASYRYGGEEFLIILPEQTLKTARMAAERLRRTVEGLAIPHEATRPGSVVTVSCGIAELAPGGRKTPEKVLKQADDALYVAKERGKNNVAVYDGGEAHDDRSAAS